MNELLMAFTMIASMNVQHVILSFDDGPSAEYTPKILKILKDNDIKANFFLVGTNVELFPDLVKQEVKEGHELGAHSMHHPELTKISWIRAQKEITDSMAIVNKFQATDLFRFPYGSFNKKLNGFVVDHGWKNIFWDVDTTDWKYKNPDIVCKKFLIRITRARENTAIILMHDIHPQTVEALPTIIKYLKDHHISTTTIKE